MVIFTLLDISLQTTWWVSKNIYYAGRYLIYGKQKTESEIMEEKMEKLIQHEADLLNEIRDLHRLKALTNESDKSVNKDEEKDEEKEEEKEEKEEEKRKECDEEKEECDEEKGKE